ncbi:hypothetical protein PDN53_29915, partial [Bacillus cereus]|uniref:hypothetical protein n=1 Tax=Bacillus thuringiensis TaxID=1428 RepID=UPI001C3C6FE5
LTFHVVCFVQFSKNYLVAHLRLPYVNIFIFQCQLSFLFRLSLATLMSSATCSILHFICIIVNTFL